MSSISTSTYSTSIDSLRGALDPSLMLIEQRNAVDQSKVLLLFATMDQSVGRIGQLLDVRVDHFQRPESRCTL